MGPKTQEAESKAVPEAPEIATEEFPEGYALAAEAVAEASDAERWP